MSKEIDSRQQYLKLDEILSLGKELQITPQNVKDFYPGMQGAIGRKNCRVCALDHKGTINVMGNDGNLKERVVVLGGKKCEAVVVKKVKTVENGITTTPINGQAGEGTTPDDAEDIEKTKVTVFECIGPGMEEDVLDYEVDRPIWACPEFVEKTYPRIIEKS